MKVRRLSALSIEGVARHDLIQRVLFQHFIIADIGEHIAQ
jgi:hypothetical protein